MEKYLTKLLLGVILGLIYLSVYYLLGCDMFKGVGFIFGIIGYIQASIMVE